MQRQCQSPYCSRFVAQNEDYCDEQCRSWQKRLRHERQQRESSGGRNNDGSKTLEHASDRPMREDELVELFDVDLNRWKVDRWNNWQQKPGVWLHQLRLKPRQDLIDTEAVLDEFIQDAVNYAPDYESLGQYNPRHPDGGYLLEINPTDLHYGMLAWAAETGSNYDSKIAHELFSWACRKIWRQAYSQYPISRVALVVGNDMLHVDTVAGDGSGGATARGTIQDVDTRFKKMFRSCRQMVVSAVDRFVESKIPTTIIVVPGNHDKERSFCLGDSFECWYRNNDYVKVQNNPQTRKYLEFGNNLIGFTHGSEENVGDLPQIMATEAAEAWSRTVYREWHIGHHHRKRQTHHIPVREEQGVRVRTFPSLAASDAWHAQKGYVGNQRACEGYVWHRTSGLECVYSANVLHRLQEEHDGAD